MYTATHESLLLEVPTLDDLIEKTAAATLGKLSDDDKRWPTQVLDLLNKNHPFIADYETHIVLDRIEPEAGAGLGYVQVHNRTMARPQDNADRPGNVLRIPIIIQDRRLHGFKIFEVGGETYPLTEDRIKQAMLNPAVFDTDSKKVPRSASLVDQIYPPYQQRQGFGRIVSPGASGLGKVASAPGGEKTAATAEEAMFATGTGVMGGSSARSMSGALAGSIAPRGLKEKAKLIAKKTAVPVGVVTALMIYFWTNKTAPARMVHVIHKVLKMPEHEAMRLAAQIYPTMKGAVGGGAAALGVGALTGLGARASSKWTNPLHDANKRS